MGAQSQKTQTDKSLKLAHAIHFSVEAFLYLNVFKNLEIIYETFLFMKQPTEKGKI